MSFKQLKVNGFTWARLLENGIFSFITYNLAIKCVKKYLKRGFQLPKPAFLSRIGLGRGA